MFTEILVNDRMVEVTKKLAHTRIHEAIIQDPELGKAQGQPQRQTFFMRVPITAGFAILIAVTSVILIVITTLAVARVFEVQRESRIDQNLENWTRSIAEISNEYAHQFDFAAIDAMFTSLIENTEFHRITLSDSNGRVISQSESTHKQGETHIISHRIVDGNIVFEIGQSVFDPGVSDSVDPILLIFLIGIISISLSFFFLTRRILVRPLIRFREAVGDIENDNWTPLGGFAGAEIADLAEGLNEMSERIKFRTNSLMETNDALNNEIELQSKTQAALVKSQKIEAIGQLTGGIAHDFNNFLAVISGNTELLEMTELDAEQRSLLGGIDDAKNRAAALTRQLLMFGRQASTSSKVIDIAETVNGMADILRVTLPATIDINFDIPSTDLCVFTDRVQIESAILNLAVNSRDAMPCGGTFLIKLRGRSLSKLDIQSESLTCEPGKYVSIKCQDTGSGMPSEVLEKACDPFYSTKQVGKGTGLGLAMIHGLVKQCLGDLKISSQPGEGTEIELLLPLVPPAKSCPPNDVKFPIIDLKSISVLVVEDNTQLRHVLVKLLKYMGHNVLQASDAAEALTVLAGNKSVDLLLTDIVMPGPMIGPGLADEARKISPDINVIFMSGYTENELVKICGRSELGYILSKPISSHELAMAIEQTTIIA